MQRNRPRIGLVLGGGGILGGAWLVGSLYALARASDWEPSWADYIVGTSAGSVVAALTAEGIPPWFIVHHQRGGNVEGMTNSEGQPIVNADEGTRRLLSWTGQMPRPILGSPALVLRTALHPWRYPPAAAMTGWVGRGFLSTDEVKHMVEMVVPKGWSRHENLWIVALDYATGKRVVFGEVGSPDAELWQAVTASCAIPGVYRPVNIHGRLYVDGGVWSPSNLDLLAKTDVDVVIAMNPMSSLQPGLPTTIPERIDRLARGAFGRRLGREARRLTDKGVKLLLVQPGAEDLSAMGLNLMDPSRRIETLETAIETTTERLREPDAREILEMLRSR